MNLLVPLVLIGWVPATLLFFVWLPAHRAVVAATIVAWLFLPVASIRLSGIPDLTKSSAPMYGLLLSLLLLDRGRVVTMRPVWLDLPMVAWCLIPLPTSLANDLGLYDGLSGVLNQTITWGLPYFLGRAYLSDLNGLRELAAGIVIGGLVYVPLCLLEIRMSPQLHRIVYGYFASPLSHAMRYGGFRPMAFMATGLELGMWMAAASLLGVHLWLSGVLKRVWGLPFGLVLLPVLVVTTVLCKSVGAMLLLGLGLAVLWTTRLTRTRLPVWALLLAPVFYEATRTTGLWDGRSGVSLAQEWIDVERASSLNYRMNNEDILIAKAVQRPVLGWGGWSRARVFDDKGQDISITDGMWIITLGNYGSLGLAALTAVLLAPVAVLARRPARVWSASAFAPAGALAVISGLYMLDNLSNAMFNPIYVLAVGGLAGLASSPSALTEMGDGLADDLEAGGPLFLAALELDADEGQQGDLSADDITALLEQERAWRSAAEWLRQRREESTDGVDLRPHLALARARLGRTLARLGRAPEAVVECENALALRVALAFGNSGDPALTREVAEARNDVAWLLAVIPDPPRDDIERSVTLARQAARAFPDDPSYWNTLGAAYCRLGDWPAAVNALGRSAALSGGTSYDDVLLAIARAEQGDLDGARRALGMADARAGQGGHRRDFSSLRNEAESLIDRSVLL